MTTIGAPPFLMARHGRVGQVFSGAAQAIAMTVLIILGLLSGLATPTETAVADLGLCLSFRGIHLSRVAAAKGPENRHRLSYLVGCDPCADRHCEVFGWILVSERIPQTIAAWVLSFTDNRIIVILLINLTVLMLVSYIPAISTWLPPLIAK